MNLDPLVNPQGGNPHYCRNHTHMGQCLICTPLFALYPDMSPAMPSPKTAPIAPASYNPRIELDLSWPYGHQFHASYNSPQSCSLIGPSERDGHYLWRIAGYAGGGTWIMETDLTGKGVGLHRHKYIKCRPQPMRTITGYINVYRNGDDIFSAGFQIHGNEQAAKACAGAACQDWVGAKLITFQVPATP